MGDRPMAVIKLVPGAKVTEEHIYKFLLCRHQRDTSLFPIPTDEWCSIS